MPQIHGEYFEGQKIGKYGLENGRVDYLTLAKSFDCILANNIMSKADDWEIVNGDYDYYENSKGEIIYEDEYEDLEDEEKEEYEHHTNEYFQTYIISESGYETLKYWTNETVWYSEELELYVWGITHYGTNWGYVLTEIEIEKE